MVGDPFLLRATVEVFLEEVPFFLSVQLNIDLYEEEIRISFRKKGT